VANANFGDRRPPFVPTGQRVLFAFTRHCKQSMTPTPFSGPSYERIHPREDEQLEIRGNLG
jgi:hypothetical protein